MTIKCNFKRLLSTMSVVIAGSISVSTISAASEAQNSTAQTPFKRINISSDQSVGVILKRVKRIAKDMQSVSTNVNGQRAVVLSQLKAAESALSSALLARGLSEPNFTVTGVHPYGRYVYALGAEIDSLAKQIDFNSDVYGSHLSDAKAALLSASAAMDLLERRADEIDKRRKLYIDCSAEKSGSGSITAPWNSLAEINDVTFLPGDIIQFKRGATCFGMFEPKGSGTDKLPISIRAYGENDAAPVINANGNPQAIYLYNVQYWELNDLELVAPGDNKSPRRGVYAVLEDFGVGRHYVFNNLHIHGVRGINNGTVPNSGKFGDASGGIIFEVKGASKKTAFDAVLVQNNLIEDVDRQGIYFWSSQRARTELGISFWKTLPGPSTAWNPQTRVIIRDNLLREIGGDGIVPKMTESAIVENNILDGFRRRSTDYNAGMWVANADKTQFQFNDTSRGRGTKDGMSYDIDHATKDVIFQYNISHNNDGGFMLFCQQGGKQTGGVVRYNLSVRDKARIFHDCAGSYIGYKVYNNTIVSDSSEVSKILFYETAAFSGVNTSRDISFTNNIFSNLGDPKSIEKKSIDRLNNVKFVNNLFWGYDSVQIPNNSVGTIIKDPRLDCHYELMEGSPGLKAGVSIKASGISDYLGRSVSEGEILDLGMARGPHRAGVPC